MPFRRSCHVPVVVSDQNLVNDSGNITGTETIGTPAGGVTQFSNIGGTPFADWVYFAPDYSVSGSQISIETVNVGTENGIDFIDVRCFGTPNSTTVGYTTAVILTSGLGGAKPPAVNGQNFTLSACMKLITSPGGLPPTFGLFIDELDANGGYLGQHGSNMTLNTTTPLDQQRYQLQTTTTFGGAQINPLVAISYSPGSPSFDFTFRIGGVRLENGYARHMHQRKRLKDNLHIGNNFNGVAAPYTPPPTTSLTKLTDLIMVNSHIGTNPALYNTTNLNTLMSNIGLYQLRDNIAWSGGVGVSTYVNAVTTGGLHPGFVVGQFGAGGLPTMTQVMSNLWTFATYYPGKIAFIEGGNEVDQSWMQSYSYTPQSGGSAVTGYTAWRDFQFDLYVNCKQTGVNGLGWNGLGLTSVNYGSNDARGGTTASQLVENTTAAAIHGVYNGTMIAKPASTATTLNYYVEIAPVNSTGYFFLGLQCANSAQGAGAVILNLTAGTAVISNGGFCTASNVVITNLNNGWWGVAFQVAFSSSDTGTTATWLAYRCDNTGNTSLTGTGAATALIANYQTIPQVPVLSFSLSQAPTSAIGGTVTPYCDAASMHLYTGATQPTWCGGNGSQFNWASILSDYKTYVANKPVWTTENGVTDELNSGNSSQGVSRNAGVSEGTNAIFVHLKQNGFVPFMYYEAVDETATSAGSDSGGNYAIHYGLYDHSFTIKPIGAAVKAIVKMLGTATGFSTDFTCTVSGLSTDQYVGYKQLLFNLNNGLGTTINGTLFTHAFVVWVEPIVAQYNSTTYSDINAATQNGTLTISSSKTVYSYDFYPGVSTSTRTVDTAYAPVSAGTGTSFNFSIVDHAIIFLIE